MKDVLKEAGVEIIQEDKKEIDRIIHRLVEVDYKNCSPAWKALKEHIKGDDEVRNRFVEVLKKELKSV
jgi:hypothetical protein